MLFGKFAMAQKGYFENNSTMTGKPINFSLVYEHRNDKDVIFPDSTYDFSPFTFLNIKYNPTYFRNNLTVDSVVYTLVCYEVDSVVGLSLPITIAHSKQKLFSEKKYISLNKIISKNDLQNPKLKSESSEFEIPMDFNFPKLLYFLLILSVSGFVFYQLFGKLINRYAKIYFFYTHQVDYTKNFKRLQKKPKDHKNLGEALVLWKTKMEHLTKAPFSSMTSKEIIERLPSEKLEEALKEFDMAIYGGIDSPHILFAYNALHDIETRTYANEMKTLKENLKKQAK